MSNSADEIMIPLNTKRGRHSESENQENKDRLSDLPDCVILHILSFLKAKYAVRTCILSTKWKNLWKRLPTLLLHSSDFWTLKSFTKFVSSLLSLRDGSIALQGLDLERNNCIELHFLKRILNYAISHNVKQLGISVQCDLHHIPPCVFSCQTLTHLKLSLHRRHYGYGKTLFPESLNLPALTSLHLVNLAFCTSGNNRAEPFSAFTRLNSLILDNCSPMDARILCISSATLVSLTMRYPSLDFHTIELSSPSLHTIAFTDTPYQLLSGSNLSSVKHVNIDAEMMSNFTMSPLILLRWLLRLTNIKSLTVSASTLQVLFLIPDLLKMKHPFLGNLKSLRIKLKALSYGFFMILRSIKLQNAKSRKEAAKLKKEPFEFCSPIPDGIVDFLLQNSPAAEVDFIKCSS